MRAILDKKYVWLIALLLFSGISLLGDAINERLTLVDFEVYYRTASRMWQGEDLYRIASDGHFVYKYAPSAVIYFMPFLLFGFTLSKFLFWGLLTYILAWLLLTISNLKNENIEARNLNLALIFSILAVLPHIHLEWHLGQVNMWLVGWYVLIIYLYQKEKDCLLGILLAASLFMKPFGLIFIPYLLWKKRFKAVLSTGINTLIIGFLPFLFYWNFADFQGLYTGWMNELQIELAAKQDLLAPANHTLFSVIARYTPLRFFLEGEWIQKGYQLIILGIMGLTFLRYMQWGRGHEKSYLGEMTLLVSWIPMLAFTSQNAFIFCLPLITFLILDYKQMKGWEKAVLIIACLCIGINMYELTGKYLHHQLMQYSIYTFGGILLSILAFSRRYLSLRTTD